MAAPKAPTFTKPKALKKLTGFGKAQGISLPKLSHDPIRQLNTVDPELARLTEALGDENLAKRIIKLKLKYPDGTYPELVTLDWLTKKHIPFGYQVWVLGGRVIHGGQVLDIIVDQGISVMVWEVQGNYWHNRPGNPAHDEAQKFALLGLTIWGKKVSAVLQLWESRIMTNIPSKREHLYSLAMQGTELGM